jgi:hypothetical protein
MQNVAGSSASHASVDTTIARRRILIGGTTLIAATVAAGCRTGRAPVSAAETPVAASPRTGPEAARALAIQNGQKPVFVPEQGANDPVSVSLADNLFWTDILMEHGKFFVMLMPGPELDQPRREAERFQQAFARQFERVSTARVDAASYRALNQSTIELAKPFIDWKHRMQAAQSSGNLRSLVWPLFFEHTAHEAERFVRRLEEYNRGRVELDRGEVVEFWAQIMEEHAEFIAHLLDPEERLLIRTADKGADLFRTLRTEHRNNPDAKAKATAEAQGIIAFKTTAEKGIREGKIKSIIHPALADHVRREAVKFKDELGRA